MGRLPLGPLDPDDAVVAEVFAGFEEEQREPIALYRVLSHAPNMLRAFSGVGRALRYQSLIRADVRELVVLRIAQLTHSSYEWSHHRMIALRAGVPEAKLRELRAWRESNVFTAEERAALLCAEQVHRLSVTDECFGELQAHFAPAEIVELVLLASHYQAVARVVQALGVEVEPAYLAYLDREDGLHASASPLDGAGADGERQ